MVLLRYFEPSFGALEQTGTWRHLTPGTNPEVVNRAQIVNRQIASSLQIVGRGRAERIVFPIRQIGWRSTAAGYPFTLFTFENWFSDLKISHRKENFFFSRIKVQYIIRKIFIQIIEYQIHFRRNSIGLLFLRCFWNLRNFELV